MSEKRKHAGGRPKAANPLATDLKVRFTAEDAQRLDAYCERNSVKRAIAIRRAVLDMIAEDEQNAAPDQSDA